MYNLILDVVKIGFTVKQFTFMEDKHAIQNKVIQMKRGREEGCAMHIFQSFTGLTQRSKPD